MTQRQWWFLAALVAWGGWIAGAIIWLFDGQRVLAVASAVMAVFSLILATIIARRGV